MHEYEYTTRCQPSCPAKRHCRRATKTLPHAERSCSSVRMLDGRAPPFRCMQTLGMKPKWQQRGGWTRLWAELSWHTACQPAKRMLLKGTTIVIFQLSKPMGPVNSAFALFL